MGFALFDHVDRTQIGHDRFTQAKMRDGIQNLAGKVNRTLDTRRHPRREHFRFQVRVVVHDLFEFGLGQFQLGLIL